MQPKDNEWLALPQVVHPPTIDAHLEDRDALVRTAECLRFFILSTEHWLSPNGRLRWWLRINCIMCAWLLILTILVMPIISLVLHQLDNWVSMLLSIVWKLILLGILVLVAVLVTKHFPWSSQGSSRRRK